MWPTLASTRYSSPSRRARVRAFAGDSTMTSGFAIDPPPVVRVIRSGSVAPAPGRTGRLSIGRKPTRPRGTDGRAAEWRRGRTDSVGEVPDDHDLAADLGDADTHPPSVRVQDVRDVVPLAGIRLGHELGVAPVEG